MDPVPFSESRAAAWHIRTWRMARRVIVFVVGFTVIAIGLAMVVLPGPAMIVIPLGLVILATEFLWAHRLLHKFKSEATTQANKFSFFHRWFGRKPEEPKQ